MPTPERTPGFAIAIGLALMTAIFVLVAGTGLTGSVFLGGLLALAAGAATWWWAKQPGRLRLDASGAPRALLITSAVAMLLALAQVGRLAVFMIDADQAAWSLVPSSRWEREHCCLTAYHVAAEASATTGGIYDHRLYSAPDDDGTGPRRPLKLGTFNIDPFEYPPPFLLLVRAAQWLTPEFLDLRMLWFGFSGVVLLAGLVATALALGPVAGTRALLLSPLLLVSLTTLNTLQKGNVQILIVAATMLAMLLFARGRNVLGGAILGFAIVSKLYPSLLVVYLVARRQWRAAAWTTGMAAGYGLLTLLLFGTAPYEAFLAHLPGLMSGEAFPAFRRAAAMAINVSIPGLVFKASLFGVPGMGFDAARTVGTIYMLIAGVLVAWAGWRTPRAGREPLLWMAILILATWRSPFLPWAYGNLPPQWLLVLIAAALWSSARSTLPAALAGFLFLTTYVPTDTPVDPRLLAIVSSLQQVLTLGLVVVALRHGLAEAETPLGVRSLQITVNKYLKAIGLS